MIPKALKEFLDEDGDRIKLRARGETSQPIGMLIIPEAKFKAVQTFLPAELSKTTPQGRSRQSMRLFFIVPDLPANITMLRDEDTTAYFSGYRMSFPAGEWTEEQPSELPTVSYRDIATLLGTPIPAAITKDNEMKLNGSGIPQEMKNANQWLVWKYGERDGKKTKIPLNPKTLTNTSAPEAAWSYEECRTAARQGMGIGFSLRNGFTGIDYDHVLDAEGNLKPEHTDLMGEIRAINSYTEISPSGEGLHIFVRCEDVPQECKAGKHTERGEIYYTQSQVF